MTDTHGHEDHATGMCNTFIANLCISVLELELLPWVGILLHFTLDCIHELLSLLNLALSLLDLKNQANDESKSAIKSKSSRMILPKTFKKACL